MQKKNYESKIKDFENQLKAAMAALKESEKDNERLKLRAVKAENENRLMKVRHVQLKNSNRKIASRLALTQANLNSLLSLSQIKRLSTKSSRGVKWSDKDIENGLEIKSMCGSTAYAALAKKVLYPSPRTLQKRTEHIKFNPGILQEVFDKLSLEVPRMNEKMRVLQERP